MGKRGDVNRHPKGLPSFHREWGELLLQTNISAVVTSLGHLPMKFFQIGVTVLALKLNKGVWWGGGGGGNHPSPSIEQKLTYFAGHEDDIQNLIQQCRFCELTPYLCF